jgi:hypothetical protein
MGAITEIPSPAKARVFLHVAQDNWVGNTDF